MAYTSLASTFNPRRNSLNALRLALAAAVILSHAWALGGYGDQPRVGGTTLGSWAVFGFFGISGYLITRSRLSGRPPAEYYWARFLRIFPAYAVCLLVVAFVFAPLSLLLAVQPPGGYSVPDGLSYVARNFFMYPPGVYQEGIGGTLAQVPFPGVWNGSLWTLFFEAGAYLVIGLLASVVRRAALPAVLALMLALGTLLSLLVSLDVVFIHPLVHESMPLLTCFAAGALAFLWSDRIPVGGWADAVVAAAMLGVILLGYVAALAALPLVYLLLRLGTELPLHRVGARTDVSYGIYIYGWPVQQCYALMFPEQQLPVGAFAVLCLVTAVPLAFISYRLVEKPAMDLRPRLAGISRRRSSAERPAPSA